VINVWSKSSYTVARTIDLPKTKTADLVFDNDGNLWVGGRAPGYLIEFDRARMIRTRMLPPSIKVEPRPLVELVDSNCVTTLSFAEDERVRTQLQRTQEELASVRAEHSTLQERVSIVDKLHRQLTDQEQDRISANRELNDWKQKCEDAARTLQMARDEIGSKANTISDLLANASASVRDSTEKAELLAAQLRERDAQLDRLTTAATRQRQLLDRERSMGTNVHTVIAEKDKQVSDYQNKVTQLQQQVDTLKKELDTKAKDSVEVFELKNFLTTSLTTVQREYNHLLHIHQRLQGEHQKLTAQHLATKNELNEMRLKTSGRSAAEIPISTRSVASGSGGTAAVVTAPSRST